MDKLIPEKFFNLDLVSLGQIYPNIMSYLDYTIPHMKQANFKWLIGVLDSMFANDMMALTSAADILPVATSLVMEYSDRRPMENHLNERLSNIYRKLAEKVRFDFGWEKLLTGENMIHFLKDNWNDISNMKKSSVMDRVSGHFNKPLSQTGFSILSEIVNKRDTQTLQTLIEDSNLLLMSRDNQGSPIIIIRGGYQDNSDIVIPIPPDQDPPTTIGDMYKLIHNIFKV
jgi:hypothetical protein